MTWLKVDDHLHAHRKTMRAGVEAMGLWVLAGSWAAAEESDGWVPAYVLSRLAGAKSKPLADRLVSAGLWHPDHHDGEDGYRFHEWADYQPTRAQLDQKRTESRERMRRNRNGVRANNADSSRELQANSARSSHAVTPAPTRPDPTRKDSGVARETKRGGPLPDDFTPNTTNQRIADEHRVDLARELAQFCDHHAAKGSTFKDWHRAFNTWLRNARPANGTSTTSPPPKRYLHAHDIESPPASLNPDNPEEYDAWYREQRKKAR